MSEGREDVDITAFEGNIVISLSIAGAGGGTRTHTLSPAADFESATSTNSITPARGCARLSIPESRFSPISSDRRELRRELIKPPESS